MVVVETPSLFPLFRFFERLIARSHRHISELIFTFICTLFSRFFAGGSERSGQQIVGPPKKKSSNEVVEDLFKGAREHGAVPLDHPGRGPGEPSKARVT